MKEGSKVIRDNLGQHKSSCSLDENCFPDLTTRFSSQSQHSDKHSSQARWQILDLFSPVT